ncbi:MAG: hypothetical protein LBR10_13565 [Prevotellaceae bacterium]|jgi:hypothetical protein|nr:hypothetical protein [Prevotellaceae bacterium]
MKKLLSIIVILSICLTSCSDDKEELSIKKEEIVGAWTMSADPVLNIKVPNAEYQKKADDMLKELFQKGDRYQFNDNLSCSITRGSSTLPIPSKYRLDKNYIIFDDYIKLSPKLSDNKLTLTARDVEIREIVKQELKKAGYPDNIIDSMLPSINGNVTLVLDKVN